MFGQTAAEPSTTTPADPDKVVTLDTFKVTTAIDTYKEDRNLSSGKMPIDMKDMAATLQVLNTSFISDKVATSLEDLYPYIVGMSREGPAAAGFTLRGYTNSATNTMINNLQTDGLPGGASRFGSPTTANVDRVEVLKGPNSVLYGAMNPGGLINIITKQPSIKTSHSVFASVGSFAGSQGTNSMGYSTSLDTTGPLDAEKHMLYRFIASYEDAPTWRQFDWSKNYYFFPSFTYRLNENTEATVKLEFHREKHLAIQDQALVAPGNLVENVPSDHSLVYQDPQNTAYEKGDVYNLTLTHHFLEKWTLHFNSRVVQHVDGRRLLENRSINVTTPIDNSTITQRLRDTWNRRRYSYFDLNLVGVVGPDTFKNTLLFGLNSGYETHNFTRWIFQNTIGAPISVYHPVPNLTTYPTVNSTTGTGPTQIAISKYYNMGAYFSDNIALGKHWRVNLGLHTEKYDTKYTDWAVLVPSGQVVNPGQVARPKSTVPSFGLVYELSDTVSFYASYAKSFKPTPPQGVAIGAASPPPETATQKEIGMKADFMERKVGVMLSLYDIARNDVIEAVPNVFDPTSGIQIYRALANQSRGVELSLNYQPIPNWQNQIGFAYNDAHVTQSAVSTLVNAQLSNAPKESANYWTRYNFTRGGLRGFGVGFGVIHTSKLNLVVDNRSPQMLTIPAVTRADLALYYKWKRYDFAVNVYNITDKSYIASGDAPTDVVPGSPRKIAVSVRFPF
ncbi:MAG: Iron complex outerrane recepter protein [Lacunisphaera sp.]|nr:Iron complex outerrane recepter protein [Lacunisphaera sp.]